MKKIFIILILFTALLFNNKLFGDPFDGPNSFGMGVLQGSIAVGDINNDGYPDLIVTGATNSSASGICRLDRYLNDGRGNLTGPVSFGTNVYISSVASGDLDCDGDPDLIVTGWDRYGNHRLDKYINNGTGVFSGPFPFGRGVNWSSIALGDIDGDGDLDLLVTGQTLSSGFTLDKYFNDGKGNFSSYTAFGVGVAMSSIALGDIDNDGDPDLIVAGADGGGTSHLIKYINDGYGVFSASDFGVSVRSSSIALGDINADGNMDLIVSGMNTGGSGVRLDKYINDGTGSFTGSAFGNSVYYGSMVLGDLNNDGSLDLVVTGRNGIGRPRWDRYLNDGNGGFTSLLSIENGAYNSSVALTDLDKNTALDLIVTGTTNSGVPYCRRLEEYMNLETTWNDPPSRPEKFSSYAVNNYWSIKWGPAVDDHTPQAMIRYHIAVGTNRGVYNYCSTNINLPSGQANAGNVHLSHQQYFQTAIPVNKTVYYKVCALDTSFAASGYSAEQTATLAADLLYPVNVDVSSARPDFRWKKKQVETNIIQISITASNMSAVFFQTNLETGTNFRLNKDLPAGPVWWRVVTYRQSCVSYFTSASARFTVDQTLPVAVFDQSDGVYTGDLSVTVSAFKDSAGAVPDTGADIIGSVYRNDSLWMTYEQNNPLRIDLSGPAKYRLQFYARDEAGNSGQPVTAEYTLVSGLKSGAAVYPTVLDLNRSSLLKFVSAEKPVSADIRILTLKGVLIKELKNINMTRGAYEWNIDDPSLFPAGQYIVKIGSQRTVLVVVK